MKRFKKALSLLLSAAVITAAVLPGTPFAAKADSSTQTTLDVSKGSINIGSSSVSVGTTAVTPNANGYIITGTTAQYTVTVTGCTANITLDSVDIAPKSGCAFELDNSSTVSLTLTGANTLDTSGSGSYRAGLSVNSGNTVSISGTGSLKATGGFDGAGIGGNGSCSCGTVNISGGTVTATGGYSGAGIGGGYAGAGGSVTISGSGTSVTATGQSGGYDVGSGSSNTGGSLTVGTPSDAAVPLPTLILASAGTNAATKSFRNCVVAGSGAENDGIDGVYDATGGRTKPIDISGGNDSITSGGTYVIKGTTFYNTISVAGCMAYITLENVDIEVQNTVGACAFKLSNATVYLTLAGTNTLQSDDNSAGLQVPQGSALTVTSASTGSLTATGGYNGAGIGGGYNGAGGAITVNGGTVNATGGYDGAGIGGGKNGDGGTISISGGTVTATGGDYGAGIGGGDGGNGGTISISDGTVTATGGDNGGAGIGGGYEGSDSEITITGIGTSVTAEGQGGGYDIGSGGGGSSNGSSLTVGETTMTTTPLPTVTLESAGIGVATPFLYLYNCVINGGGAGSLEGLYDSSGSRKTLFDIGEGGVSIGSTVLGYDSTGARVTATSSDGYVIEGTATASDTVAVTDGTQDVTLDNVDIDVSGNRGICAFSVSAGAAADLTLVGINTLASGANKAGLSVNSGSTVCISGAGLLTAAGGSDGAGIGGNYWNAGGTITINGGTVTANGGNSGAGIGGGCYGIGGGSYGTGGAITINDGTVTATGGSYGGAGIGGGYYAAGATVAISGAGTSVTAKGQGGGYDVGSGNGYSGSDCGNLTVGDANMATTPLPTVTLESAGTNAAYSFVNCVISGTGAAAQGIAGTYYAVVYELDGGTNASSTPSVYKAGTGIAALGSPSRTGYAFGGWYTDSSFSAASKVTSIGTAQTGIVTLYAQWTANTSAGGGSGPAAYFITYVLNGGVNSASNPSWYAHGTGATLNDPTKTGYTFGGWYTDSSLTAASRITAISATQAGNVTLYAQWTAVPSFTPGVSYTAHVQNIGWQKFAADGEEAGTEGKALRMEAVQIKLTGNLPAGASIAYQAYVQNVSWQAAVCDGALSGTTGKGLRLEALRVTLSGLAGYTVKYRAYVQRYGWLDWVTTANGTDVASAAVAGTTGKGLRLEAIEIEIVKIS